MRFIKTTIIVLVLTAFAFASLQLARFAAADIYACAGKRQFAAGDYQRAEILLAKGIDYAGSNADYHYAYARALYFQAKQAVNTGTALKLLLRTKELHKRATELNPLEGNHWLGLAQTQWWLGRFNGREQDGKKAASSFLQALATDPNNGKFLYALVNYYLSTGRHEQSLSHVKQLARVYPGAYPHLKEHPHFSDEVLIHFTQGLETVVGDMLVGRPALDLLASMAAERRNWSKAVAYTEQMIQKSSGPIPSGLYVRLGEYYLNMNDYGQARNAFSQGLKLSDDREGLLRGLISSFQRAGALDLYIELCQEIGESDAIVQSALPFVLGKACYYNNDLERATQHFQRSLARKETPEAHRYLAEIALKRKDWDTAELESQRATTLEPENAHHHYLFARSLFAQEKYEAALKAIDQAIQYATPPRHYYFSCRGRVNWALERPNAAVEDWKAGYQLSPNSTYYPLRIAKAYKKLKDYTNAKRYFLAASSLKPDDEKLRLEFEEVRKLGRVNDDKSAGSSEQ
ncbi:MAG: tetratricopeptide repeat protein [Deltaproteobacteria bacterium]|nr:MAG: tetratricopeptide repeat protein [Deltaproteobacteria bacterium]